MLQVNKWHNCYDEGWKDLIVPEAFAHPAKMSYGLLKRIFFHATMPPNCWLKEGDVIVDPFGGIGSTGILGAYEGYLVICCELEAKFCKLAEQNFELHKDAWLEFGNPFPIILQGDSRRLCEVVEKADLIVSSPPFLETQPGGTAVVGKFTKRPDGSEFGAGKAMENDYGSTPGQLGAMKPGKVDAIISSPPYAESLKGDGAQNETAAESRDKRRTPGGSLGQSQRTQGYGSKGNLGNLKAGKVDMVVSSPPFQGSQPQQDKNFSAPHDSTRNLQDSQYAASSGNLGNLGNLKSGDVELQLCKCGWPGIIDDSDINDKGDTFWQAAKTIVEQCHQILKPGGHAIWVVKSFVRNKKIVDFPGDWQRLCESVGFKTVCIHHAMLVKETSHKTLFGDTETKRKERKSFFRRLAESKGSPRIDYEVVLCMEKG